MSKNISIKARISEFNRRKKALIIFEGKTDPKIYEKIISDNIPKQDRKDFNLYKFSDFEECKSGGCGQIIDWINREQDFLDNNSNIENMFLAIIDGDAYEYKRMLQQRVNGKLLKKDIAANKFVHRLNLYSIESYAFDEQCLIDILYKYLDTTKSDIEECLGIPLFNYVESNLKDISFKLACLCLLAHIANKKVSCKFSYGILLDEYKSKEKLIHELNEQSKLLFEKITPIKDILLEEEYDMNLIKKITKGKHLIFILDLILKDILYNMKKHKICDYSESQAFKEISCTKQDLCDRKECTYKIGKSKPSFKGTEAISYIESDIFDHFNTKDIFNEISDNLTKILIKKQ